MFTVRNLFLHHFLSVDDDDTLIAIVNTLSGDVVGCGVAVCFISIDLIDCRWLHALELYLTFNVHGGVFKTEEFKALGGLKTSMKLSFWYEFLFRALYKQKQIFVIQRIGYYHRVNVPDSLTDEYTKTMSEKEADWWIELAKKEYFFPQDRKKTYEE